MPGQCKQVLALYFFFLRELKCVKSMFGDQHFSGDSTVAEVGDNQDQVFFFLPQESKFTVGIEELTLRINIHQIKKISLIYGFFLIGHVKNGLIVVHQEFLF